MAESRLVRDATVEDAAACAAIYAPYVRDTVVSFELEPPTPAQMAGRIEAALARHAWLVLEDDGRVVGYAYGSTFNARAGYAWSTSVSVYTEPGRRRTGAGRALYTALLDRLAARGYRNALAGARQCHAHCEQVAFELAQLALAAAVGMRNQCSDDDAPPALPR